METIIATNSDPATGVIYLRPPGDLPKKTVGKRLGVTAFVLSLIPLIWYALILVVIFFEQNIPAKTGLHYVAKFLWYIGLVLIPIFIIGSILLGVIALLRPSVSGKIWAVITLILALVLLIGFLFGFFAIQV